MQDPPGSDFDRASHAARVIHSVSKLRPRIGLVLGSGLGALADTLHDATVLAYAKIPHFPLSTATGHAGNLVLGTLDNLPLVVMQGRLHLYEGYTAAEVAFPIRVLAQVGIQALVLTNSAGAINPQYTKGDLVVLRDHISLLTHNPLIGPHDERLGLRHPDMSDPYDPRLRRIAQEELQGVGQKSFEAVYAAVQGPSFETPAEINLLRVAGADLVGMSTALEVIAARQAGLDVLAISCVTNMAAGITGEKITEEEVLETGERVRGKFLALLRGILPKIALELSLDG